MTQALKIASALGGATAAATDPYFSNVSLLLHGDGTNGAQNNTFIDGSSNNFTITRNGNTTQGSFSPFTGTGGSGYFDGTGDYLGVSSSLAFPQGTEDFTVEFWLYWAALPSASDVAFIACAGGGLLFGIYNFKNDIMLFNGGWSTNINFGSKTQLPINQWNHLALTRSGNVFRCYVNGTKTSSGDITNTMSMGSGGTARVASEDGTKNYVNGYISNLRVLRGTALYTGTSFTPPTSPLTAITNTSLLLNFTNAGITDSARKADLETVGNAQVSTSVVKYGTGSMAFDGTGDWLTSPDSTNLQLGTGAFTIECWLYLSATGAARGIVGKGTATTGWLLSVNASNQVVFTDTTTAITSTGTLSGTTWYHIAVVREGTGSNQTKIYIGGSNDGTGTSATNFNQTNIMYVGANRTGGDALNGYIDDLRITKGVARTITVPTAAYPDS